MSDAAVFVSIVFHPDRGIRHHLSNCPALRHVAARLRLADRPDPFGIPRGPPRPRALFGLGIRHDHRPVGCKLVLLGLGPLIWTSWSVIHVPQDLPQDGAALLRLTGIAEFPGFAEIALSVRDSDMHRGRHPVLHLLDEVVAWALSHLSRADLRRRRALRGQLIRSDDCQTASGHR
jgi:hypothetical protein